MLIHYLAHKKALEENSQPTWSLNSNEENQLLTAFKISLRKTHKAERKSQIKGIETYIQLEKFTPLNSHKWNSFFSTANTSIPIAEEILMQLKSGDLLQDITKRDDIRTSLSTCPKLHYLISTFFREDKLDQDINKLTTFLNQYIHRLPENNPKRLRLTTRLTTLSNTKFDINTFEDFLKETKVMISQHQTKGIKGFFQLNGLRDTKGTKEFKNIFKI